MKKSIFKRTVSLVLVAALIAAMAVIGTASPNVVEYGKIPSLSGGKVAIVGGTTTISYDEVEDGAVVHAQFKVYGDPETYDFFLSTNLKFTVNASVLAAEDVGSEGLDQCMMLWGGDPKGATSVRAVVTSMDRETFLDAPVEADGYCATFAMKYKIKDAEAFKKLSPSAGSSVMVEPYKNDLNFIIDGKTVEIPAEQVILLPATVTYAASKITLDANGGEGAELPENVAVGNGMIYAIPEVSLHRTTSEGVYQVVSGWNTEADGTGTAYPLGGNVTMGTADLTLYAQYADSKDGDDIPDDMECTVSFTVRSGDEAEVTYPSETAHGEFFDVGEDGSGKICIEQNKKLSDAVPAVTGKTDDWKFQGFYIKGQQNNDLSAYTVKDDVEIEIRMMLDANGDDVDDRENVELEIVNGTKPIASIEVPDGTPYTIYEDKNGTKPAVEGTCDGDQTKVDVSGKAPAKDSDGNPLKDWQVVPRKDDPNDPDKITGVDILPMYEEKVPVYIPGPVAGPVADPSDPVTPPENSDPMIASVPDGTQIVYNDIYGEPLKTLKVDREEAEGGVFRAEAPVPGKVLPVQRLPEKNEDGNAFDYWKLVGPNYEEVGGETVPTYYAEPVYKETNHLNVVDPGEDLESPDDDIPVIEGDVPEGTKVIVLDENHDPKHPLKEYVAEDDIDISLPAVVSDPKEGENEIPFKDADGNVFQEWEAIPEDTDGDGVADKYIMDPKYDLPDAEEIEILPDPNAEAIDALTGEGYTILSGAWNNDAKVTAKFYIRICGEPAGEVDKKNLNVAVERTHGFEAFMDQVFGNFGYNSFKYDGKETVDGVEYGVFSIEYVTLKSSVVKITATYGAKDTTVMKGHTAITVGDIDKDAKVNSRDVTELLRVENDFTKVAKGSEGGYAFELADCDKNTKVNSIDVSIMLRMINDLVASN